MEKLDVAEEAGSWFLEGNPSVDYYYKAIANDSYWTGYTWEPDLKNNTGAYTATYGRAVYDRDGILLGVAGADIYVDDLMDILKGISLKGSGIVALYDSNVQYVAGNIENGSLPFHPENLQKEIQISQEGAAAFDYTDAEGKEYGGDRMAKEYYFVFYSALAVILLIGAKAAGRNMWREESLSLKSSKGLFSKILLF